jgi:nucleoside-diphosphate-sugar epimerase
VRHSLEHPQDYVDANITGHLAVLELGRRLPGFRHLVYASSSSVYGGNDKLPFAVDDPVDRPLSIYGARLDGWARGSDYDGVSGALDSTKGRSRQSAK